MIMTMTQLLYFLPLILVINNSWAFLHNSLSAMPTAASLSPPSARAILVPAFVLVARPRTRPGSSCCSSLVLHLSAGNNRDEDGDNDDDNDDDDDDDTDMDFFSSSSLNDFLDKPFFNPDAYQEDDDSFLGRLANFVRSDYELAETLLAGSLFVILLLITQELLRMQLYGDNYVPFTSGNSRIGGRLF